jgi:hypothetical protein
MPADKFTDPPKLSASPVLTTPAILGKSDTLGSFSVLVQQAQQPTVSSIPFLGQTASSISPSPEPAPPTENGGDGGSGPSGEGGEGPGGEGGGEGDGGGAGDGGGSGDGGE